MTRTALVIEDDAATREALALLLDARGLSVTAIGAYEEAAALLVTEPDLDVVLTDLGLPDGDAGSLVGRFARLPSQPAVLVVTGDTRLSRAVDMMREGATDFLTKPIDAAQLDLALARALSALEARDERHRLQRALRHSGNMLGVIGRSPPMRQVFERAQRVAPSDLPVYVLGESGTGKELLAQAVHRLSRREAHPFVALNCGAIPRQLAESELFGHEQGAFTGASRAHAGAFERARGGTLFLDELTEMPLDLQVVLLRVLETQRFTRIGGRREQEADVRIIAASNRDPQVAVAEGRLREDLFFRLHVVPITLPPLRERGQDVMILAEHFLAEGTEGASARPILSPAAREAIAEHHFPGNVRELRNAIRRAVVLARGGVIEPVDLGLTARASHRLDSSVGGRAAGAGGQGITVPSDATLAEAEHLLIRAALERHGMNRTAAARSLGISVKTLYNRCRESPDLVERA